MPDPATPRQAVDRRQTDRALALLDGRDDAEARLLRAEALVRGRRGRLALEALPDPGRSPEEVSTRALALRVAALAEIERYPDLQDSAQSLLARPDATSAERAEACFGLARHALWVGDRDEALASLTAADTCLAAVDGDVRRRLELVEYWLEAGDTFGLQGPEGGEALLDALAGRIDEPWARVRLGLRVARRLRRGPVDEAVAATIGVVEAAREHGDPWLLALALSAHAEQLARRDERAGALDALRECHELVARVEPTRVRYVELELAHAAWAAGEQAEAGRILDGILAVQPPGSNLSAVASLLQLPALVHGGRHQDVAEVLRWAPRRLQDARYVSWQIAEALVWSEDGARDEAWDPLRPRLLSHALAHAVGDGRSSLAETARTRLRDLGRKGAGVPLDELVLFRPLGRGGMGEVWEAELAGHPVAVKLITAEGLRSPRMRSLLEREIAAVAALSHPSVVPLHDRGVVTEAAEAMTEGRLVAGSPWLAMARADSSLVPYLGRLPWPRLRAVLLHLLDALAHAHAHGLLHLDVKPENLLVVDRSAPAREVWLADFGLARVLDQPDDGRVAGTPAYMAPERLVAGGDIGPSADLYAVGCVGWELATGSPPFPYTDLARLRRAHRQEAPGPLRPVVEVPAGYEAWLRRLLAKPPSARFPSAGSARWHLLDLEDADGTTPPVAATPTRSGATTFGWSRVMEPADGASEADGEMEADGDGPPPVPLPADWRDVPQVVGRPELTPHLLELREPPLVGREAERDALWRLLRSVVADDGCRVAMIRGTTGSGRGRLLRWLLHTAYRTGAVTTCRTTGGALPAPGALPAVVAVDDPDAALLPDLVALREADPAVLVVGRLPVDAAHDLVDAADVIVDLEPLPDEDVAQLLWSMFPLAPQLRQDIVAVADGDPALALRTLRWVASERLLHRDRVGWVTSSAGPLEPPFREERFADLLSALEPTGTLARVATAGARLGQRVDEARWISVCAALGIPGAPEVIRGLRVRGWLRAEGAALRWVAEGLRLVLAARPPDWTPSECATVAALLDPDAPALPELLLAAGRRGEALAALERQAWSAYERGRAGRARRLWSAWTRHASDDACGVRARALGLRLSASGGRWSSLEQLGSLVARSAEDVEDGDALTEALLAIARGKAWRRAPDAVAAYRRAAAGTGRAAGLAWYELSLLLGETGDDAAVEEALARAEALGELEQVALHRAELAVERGGWEEAEAALRRVDAGPQAPPWTRARALTLDALLARRRGDSEGAAALLRQAVRAEHLRGSSTVVRVLSAAAALRLGRPGDARSLRPTLRWLPANARRDLWEALLDLALGDDPADAHVRALSALDRLPRVEATTVVAAEDVAFAVRDDPSRARHAAEVAEATRLHARAAQ